MGNYQLKAADYEYQGGFAKSSRLTYVLLRTVSNPGSCNFASPKRARNEYGSMHNYLFESADHEYHFRFVKGLDMGAWEVIRKYPNTATPKCAPTRSGVVRSTSELV